MKKLLKGGRVVDPRNGIDGAYDVLIEGDRIARVDIDFLGGPAPAHPYPGCGLDPEPEGVGCESFGRCEDR